MLSATHRLRRRVDFADTVRRGARASAPTLVVHLLPAPDVASASGPRPAVRAGFVVSRAVGPSVVRHRVTRRLRHLVGERLHRLAPGTTVVVRALPPSAAAASPALARDLDRALDRALDRCGATR